MIALSWRLLRGGGRREVSMSLLAVAAFAAATAMLLAALAVNLGFAHRADRAAWTFPRAATTPGSATAVQSLRTDHFDGRPITVVTLGRLRPDAPTPPGLPRFPAGGERWVSPDLARLIAAHPGTLEGRWSGRRAGIIRRDGLRRPNELLVVRAVAPDSPVLRTPPAQDSVRSEAQAGPVPIARFADAPRAEADPLYANLSLIATVLLVVPLLVLGGAAARLGLARRDHRLAVLRLVGASSRQIVGLVAFESALTAAAGALAGSVLYLAGIPLLARLSFDGGPFFARDVWVGGATLALVVAGVSAAGSVSALVTLGRVLVSPLGVTQRHATRGRHLWRLAAFVAVLGGYLVFNRELRSSLVALVIGFAVVFAALAILGPWLIAMVGRVLITWGRGPARLLAGRRLLDDPKAAWRTVGGLALTGFVAGFLALFPTSSGEVVYGRAGTLDVAVPAQTVAAARTQAVRGLREAGLPASVASGRAPGALLGTQVGSGSTRYLAISVTAADRERVRSVVERALPGAPTATGADVAALDDQFPTDLRRASLTVLIAALLIAMASAGITACAAVLDRSGTYRVLHLAGMPLSLLDAARRHETTAPLLLLLLGSLATGVLCASPVTKLGFGGGQLDVGGVGLLAGTVLAGTLGVRLASAASRPLLRAVAADAASRPI